MGTIYFEDVEVGDELPALRETLRREQVRLYAQGTRVRGGRFDSDAAARAEGLPGQIAPGNLSMALLSRAVTNWGEQVRLKRLSATLRSFVHPEVPLLVHAVVTEKHASEDGTFVECDLIMENGDGDRLITGTATVLLPSRTELARRDPMS